MSATQDPPKILSATLFEVKIPVLESKGLTLGYFTTVSGFSAQVDVLEYAEGGINDYVHRLPSRIKQGNITLKRGVVAERVLYAWLLESVVKANPTDLSVKVLDTYTDVKATWSFRNAYPVKWTNSDLNAGSNEFLTETLEIAHNGMTVQ
jgi:phage tail-like protein